MTTLKALLPEKETHIEYRAYSSQGADCLVGFCHWDGHNLKPLGITKYSLEDQIESYEWDGDKNLIVWKKAGGYN